LVAFLWLLGAAMVLSLRIGWRGGALGAGLLSALMIAAADMLIESYPGGAVSMSLWILTAFAAAEWHRHRLSQQMSIVTRPRQFAGQ
jgi:hypothetical protein